MILKPMPGFRKAESITHKCAELWYYSIKIIHNELKLGAYFFFFFFKDPFI